MLRNLYPCHRLALLARFSSQQVQRCVYTTARAPHIGTTKASSPQLQALGDVVTERLASVGWETHDLEALRAECFAEMEALGPNHNWVSAQLEPYFTNIPESSRSLVAATLSIAEAVVKRRLGSTSLPRPAPERLWDSRPVTPRTIGQTETPNAVEPLHVDTDTLEPQVLVIGGAAAGLAAGACLAHEGIGYTILEQDEAIGAVWQNRYDRLHLHDIIDQCHMPFLPMPDTYPVYVSRMQFVHYLQSYQRMLGLNVKLGHKVSRAFKTNDGRWEVHALDSKRGEQQTYRPQVLVIANGMFTKAHVPSIADAELFKGQLLHSSEYRTGAVFAGKRVLVVGTGNSGAEIACDLWEQGAKPTILQRSPSPIIPRWLIGLTQQTLYRPIWKEALEQHPEVFWEVVDGIHKWLCQHEIGDVQALGLKLSEIPPVKGWRDMFSAATMDIGTVELVRRKEILVVNQELDRFVEDGVIFQGSEQAVPFDAVVFATGYHMSGAHQDWLCPDLCKQLGSGWDFIKEERVGEGAMAHVAGGPCPVPGLHFLWGNLQMIRDSAPSMARHIKALAR